MGIWNEHCELPMLSNVFLREWPWALDLLGQLPLIRLKLGKESHGAQNHGTHLLFRHEEKQQEKQHAK